MAVKRKIKVKRGDVFLVNFDPTIGSEIQKTRPAIVLQNDIANTYSSVTIVAAITSKSDEGKLYPTEVEMNAGAGGLLNDSVVLLNQVRTIDKQRLVTKLGSIDTKTLARVNEAIQISLGIIDV